MKSRRRRKAKMRRELNRLLAYARNFSISENQDQRIFVLETQLMSRAAWTEEQALLRAYR